VSTVTILELDGLRTCGQSEKLVAQADTHDGKLIGLHKLTQVVDGILAMNWVSGAVGDEDTVEVVCDLVNRIGGREDGYGGTTGDLD
jgi:hypothetical protein